MPYTITAVETKKRIVEILKTFKARSKEGVFKQMAQIENVSFKDLFVVYGALQNLNRRLYMPGDLDNETMMVIYTPCIGCTIVIESEPCIDFLWKIRNTEFNWN